MTRGMYQAVVAVSPHIMQPFQTYPHPLAGAPQIISCTVIDAVRRKQPNATLTDIARGRPGVPMGAWMDYLDARKKRVCDLDRILAQSLLATADLHQRGVITRIQAQGVDSIDKIDQELLTIAREPYTPMNKRRLLRAYKLDKWEVLAVEGYSNANKSVPMLGNSPNPHFMGAATHWGTYGDGWHALDSALTKIPTLDRLGLAITTYRAPREPKGDEAEMTKIRRLAIGTNIHHGTVRMDMGQLHYLSTGITYNPHWTRAPQVGGIIAVTGASGRYINPFGLQGWVDGAEVLYPPGCYTKLHEIVNNGYVHSDGHSYPVAHLREIARPQPGKPLVACRV